MIRIPVAARRTLTALAVAAPCLLGSAALGQNKAFPDEWFFEAAGRPAELKKLEGMPATELAIDKWIGDGTSLEANRGKVIVLDFWATWCGPCVAAIPHNVELVKKYKDQGLVFIGVHDARNGWDSADSMVKEKKINYPVGLDKKGPGGAGVSTKNYNLQFWPTYVVIDRAGTVRGAGLTPDSVEKAVKLLLAEAPPAGAPAAGAQAGGFPAEWYYAGGSRPASLKKLEGTPAPAVSGESWIGTEVGAAAWKEHVVVLHFLSPTNSVSLAQLGEIAAAEKEFGPQGVVFVGISDRRGDWEQFKGTMKARGIAMPLVRDAAVEGESAQSSGATAKAYGIRFVPSTVVIDRTGKVRAAGVRADKVKAVVGKLLAERVPEAAPKAGGEG